MRRARSSMAFVGAVALGRGVFTNSRGLCALRVPQVDVARTAGCRVTVRCATKTERGKTQQETDWNMVRVLENSVPCEAHRYLVIDVGTTGSKGSLCDAYRVPGMYVQVRPNADTKPAFLAVSSAPNIQGVFEFLIKDSEALSWVAGLCAGDEVQMSPVQGKGFPIVPKLDLLGYPPIPEDEVPRDVLLFATGSGIAPIRACIESMLNGVRPKERRNVRLYYGARYPERMPYMDRFGLWEEDNVEVMPVISRPQDSPGGWNGRIGYVQDALREDGVIDPKATGAILCGVKGMCDDVRQMLTESGVREDRILLNF